MQMTMREWFAYENSVRVRSCDVMEPQCWRRLYQRSLVEDEARMTRNRAMFVLRNQHMFRTTTRLGASERIK